MRPPAWHPPVELSAAEQAIVARIRRAKLFVFLRRIRHELFSPAFQAELAGIYAASPQGHPPVPPAQLALATILQAYTGVSDDEVIEALTMDRRWQLVLDCLDCSQAPFSKATLVRFRAALIAHDLDRRLIERTVDLAERDRGVGPRPLRAALDSSPLWGAGRVEDTWNLLGHALRKALGVLARQQGRGLADVAAATGAPLVGGTSLKAALDLDWDDPTARDAALGQVLAALVAVERAVADCPGPTAQASVAAAHQIAAQDVGVGPDGAPRLRQGVAADRRISIEDPAMRHGRKSRSERVDGYKRHALRDLDRELVRAVGVTAANVPEAEVTDAITADLVPQQVRLVELYIDRGYLSSRLVRERPADLTIYCKAWPVHTGPYFAKTAFTVDWAAGTLRCPGGVTIPCALGMTVHFPAERCAVCPLRPHCTGSAQGRSITLHPDERLLAELRARQQTAAGRAKLRERVAIEHTLAHLGRWQGWRARYCGERKNLFDLRRVAVVHNLHVLQRSAPASEEAVA
jgi:transposase